MMSDKIDWTKDLGDAVLAQQPDVMDAIQRLRAKAQTNNKLVTTKQQKVSVQKQDNKEVIVIEPAQPTRCTCPITILPPSMARGPMRNIRRIISAIRPISAPA